MHGDKSWTVKINGKKNDSCEIWVEGELYENPGQPKDKQVGPD